MVPPLHPKTSLLKGLLKEYMPRTYFRNFTVFVHLHGLSTIVSDNSLAA